MNEKININKIITKKNINCAYLTKIILNDLNNLIIYFKLLKIFTYTELIRIF